MVFNCCWSWTSTPHLLQNTWFISENLFWAEEGVKRTMKHVQLNQCSLSTDDIMTFHMEVQYTFTINIMILIMDQNVFFSVNNTCAQQQKKLPQGEAPPQESSHIYMRMNLKSCNESKSPNGSWLEECPLLDRGRIVEGCRAPCLVNTGYERSREDDKSYSIRDWGEKTCHEWSCSELMRSYFVFLLPEHISCPARQQKLLWNNAMLIRSHFSPLSSCLSARQTRNPVSQTFRTVAQNHHSGIFGLGFLNMFINQTQYWYQTLSKQNHSFQAESAVSGVPQGYIFSTFSFRHKCPLLLHPFECFPPITHQL